MIDVTQTNVFYSPIARRRFLTKKSAISAEAAAMIKRKYPTEKAEYDEHGCTYRGFHWREDDRLVRLHKKLMKCIARAFDSKR